MASQGLVSKKPLSNFGGWPWESNDVTFGDEKRFALFNGKKDVPPPLAKEDARDW